jgi:hypothetical protein
MRSIARLWRIAGDRQLGDRPRPQRAVDLGRVDHRRAGRRLDQLEPAAVLDQPMELLGPRQRLTDRGARADQEADHAEAPRRHAALGEMDPEVVVGERAIGRAPDRLVEVHRDAQVAV